MKLEIFAGVTTRESAFYHVPVIAGKDVHTKITIYSSYRISMVHLALTRAIKECIIIIIPKNI
jgi:hypothetical protein